MADDTNIMSEPSKLSQPSPEPKTTESSSSITESLKQLTEEVSKLRKEIKEKDDTISQLNEHILYIETETPSHNKKRKFSNSAQIEDEDETMKNLKIENEQLKQQIDTLKNPETATMNTRSNQIQTTEENASNTDTQSPEDIMKMIKKELSFGFSEIKENVKQLIETKFNKLPTVTNDAIPTDSTDSPTTTYASAAGNNHVSGNLRSIMMTTKNEEITEQNEKKRRAKNIIVFGKSEHSQRWQKAEDEEFAKQLLKDIQVGSVKIKEINRIGEYNREATKDRPMKITVDTEEEQQKIMTNLNNLKGNEEYRGISIKEDYTLNERQLIRVYVEQAKALNALEKAKSSTTVYKVRGTPKNGLFLKRFATQKETTVVISQ